MEEVFWVPSANIVILCITMNLHVANKNELVHVEKKPCFIVILFFIFKNSM